MNNSVQICTHKYNQKMAYIRSSDWEDKSVYRQGGPTEHTSTNTSAHKRFCF